MKSGLLLILYANPFECLYLEDVYTYLTKFYELSGTLGLIEKENEPMFMRLLPHILIGKVKEWYLDQSTKLMTNWNTLEKIFFDRFFPHNKFMKENTIIIVFSQGLQETLCEAYKGYKSM